MEILGAISVKITQPTTALTVLPGCSTSSHLILTVSVWLGSLKVAQLVRAVVQLILVVRTAAMMMEQTELFPLTFLFLPARIVIKLLATTTMLFLNSAVPSVETESS